MSKTVFIAGASTRRRHGEQPHPATYMPTKMVLSDVGHSIDTLATPTCAAGCGSSVSS
jgi:hypothetical protein